MQQDKKSKVAKSDQNNAEGTELFTKVLNMHGGRLTEERRDLLRTVLNMKGHFDAEEIQQALIDQAHQVSPATVYRNLALLVDAGIIRRVSLSLGDQSRMQFESILGVEHHDHLLCLGCGKNVEFSYPAIDVLQDAVAKEHGFMLARHHLELLGYCQTCQQESSRIENEKNPEQLVVRLVDLKSKTVAKIVRLSGGKSIVDRLHGFGFHEGRVIRLLRVGVFGGPLLVEDLESQARIMAAKDLAAHVLVQEVRDGE